MQLALYSYAPATMLHGYEVEMTQIFCRCSCKHDIVWYADNSMLTIPQLVKIGPLYGYFLNGSRPHILVTLNITACMHVRCPIKTRVCVVQEYSSELALYQVPEPLAVIVNECYNNCSICSSI